MAPASTSDQIKQIWGQADQIKINQIAARNKQIRSDDGHANADKYRYSRPCFYLLQIR